MQHPWLTAHVLGIPCVQMVKEEGQGSISSNFGSQKTTLGSRLRKATAASSLGNYCTAFTLTFLIAKMGTSALQGCRTWCKGCTAVAQSPAICFESPTVSQVLMKPEVLHGNNKR